MRQTNHSAARVQMPTLPTVPAPLAAAYDVFALLGHIRFALMEAELRAEDGGLPFTAPIREQIDLVNRLLADVTTTAKALEAARKAVKP